MTIQQIKEALHIYNNMLQHEITKNNAETETLKPEVISKAKSHEFIELVYILKDVAEEMHGELKLTDFESLLLNLLLENLALECENL